MTLKASCHCGATQLRVTRPPDSVTRCNCSLCSKRGSLAAYYTPDEVSLLTSPNRVSTYQWGDYLMHLHFCGICGCSTYAESPGWCKETNTPDYSRPRVTINARLFDDFDLDAVPIVDVDGKSH